MSLTIEFSQYPQPSIASQKLGDAVSTQDQAIHAILRNPPNVRRTGFGFIGVEKIEYSPEGIKGIDVWGYEVVILRNGFIELRRPLSSTHFQHFRFEKIESGFSADSKWLYPYAVCELPVTFMKLVKAIYSAVGIDSKIIVQQEYRNLCGFLLVGRHPSNPLFGRVEETNLLRFFNLCICNLTRLGRNRLLNQSLSQIGLLTIW